MIWTIKINHQGNIILIELENVDYILYLSYIKYIFTIYIISQSQLYISTCQVLHVY